MPGGCPSPGHYFAGCQEFAERYNARRTGHRIHILREFGNTGEVNALYRRFLKWLTCPLQRQELSSNPYSRVHQEKILRFRQEVACASDVLNDQLNCVRELLVYIDKSVSEIPHMFQRRREHYILLDCISTIRARTQSFREMSEDAAQLASWVSKISVTSAIRYSRRKLTVTSYLEHRPYRI